MKPRLLELVRETSTAESVYAEKYEWLMRWALHFCNGDREMAEDLVQDTFVRMISSWQTIRDLENPERFLYTYLKYGFLRLRADDKRQTMQSMSIDELDILERRLPESGPDLLEWQQDIRAIVDFLCWRKNTAKSASLLLLRFFHGLFPAEIMRVARLTRKATDDGLASARHEARTCATKRPMPNDFTFRGRGRAGNSFAPHALGPLPSTEEFMRQMLAFVFASRDGDCLSAEALRARYSNSSRSPIDCWLLSHIVSCERCLDLVLEVNALPPAGTRPLEDILGCAPKSEAAKPRKKAAPVSAAMRSMAAARVRYRETLEHRPRSISVGVDGQSLASRDVSSVLNQLTLDLRAGTVPELIEISGDRALLLAIPVMATPPNAAPVQHFDVELTGGRSLELALEFNATGIRLHVIYRDPLFHESASTVSSPERHLALAVPQAGEGRDGDSVAIAGDGLRSKIAEWFKRPFDPLFKLSVAFAGIGLVCVAGYRHVQRPKPSAVLTQAVNAVRQQTTGVVTQRVRIASHTAHGVFSYDVTLHRDLSRRLKSKLDQSSAAQAAKDTRIESAKIAWSDPLSPSSFRQWRDEQRDPSDELVQLSNGLVTVTSKVSSGPVREESLTLDAKTLHAVGRKVSFRVLDGHDRDEIEIAELDYRVVPLSSSDPSWFEPLVEIHDAKVTPSARMPLPRVPAEHPTPGQLDVAELNVRLALVELQADGRERLAIRRDSAGVVLEGLVATDERKQEIDRRLRQVAHVTSAVRTFADFAAAKSTRRGAKQATEFGAGSGAQGNDADGVEGVAFTSATDRLSPLDRLAPERHLSVEQLDAIHAALLHAAVELRHSAAAMRDLDRVGGSSTHGNPGQDEIDLRSQLMSVYSNRIRTATEKETMALGEIGIAMGDAAAAPPAPLWDIATTNAQLCFELISQQAEDPRPAQTILQELATSARTLQLSLNGLARSGTDQAAGPAS